MKSITDLFQGKTYELKATRRTERGDLITEFTATLNKERGDYEPLKLTRIAYLLSIYNTQELYFFFNKCQKAKNFSKCFWYHVKPRYEIQT